MTAKHNKNIDLSVSENVSTTSTLSATSTTSNSDHNIREAQSQLERIIHKIMHTSKSNNGKTDGFINGYGTQKHHEMTILPAEGGIEISGDFYVEKGELIRKYGINWLVAALFIVADMAGGGIVALPSAIVRCSFSLGLILLLLLAILATSSSILLGKAWNILLQQYPIYRTHCRKPYAEIGYRALGARMKKIVSFCLNVTQFGASTVFLLLIARNGDDFLRVTLGWDVGLCLMIVVTALILLPITMLKSPQDFWLVVVFGMVSTGFAVLLVCVGATMDSECLKEQQMPPLEVQNVLIALGTIMFTFGGHSALPTIQHDMRRPAEFGKSSILAFSLITGMNLVVVLFGGLTYGNSLDASVIDSIQTPWIQQAINVMIIAHCLLTFTLIINPLNQEIEELFNVPQGFSPRRVFVRIGTMTLAVAIGATVPTFDSILNLIGGLAFTLISMVFPCLFYLYLSANEKKEKEKRRRAIHQLQQQQQQQHRQEINQTTNEQTEQNATSFNANDANNVIQEYCTMSFMEMIERTEPQILFLCGIICLTGALSGAIATIMAVKSMVITDKPNFARPCYLKFFMDDTVSNSTNHAITKCCGAFQNISTTGRMCKTPDLNFYTP